MASKKKSKLGNKTPARGSYNIREVALAANVSVATVSRTLQKPEVVSSRTRSRVRAAIDRLGYTPNAQARMLRTSRTHVIVALVPDIANPFFTEVIRGIEQVAHQHGYSILLGDTQKNRTRENTYANLLATKQADGLITLLPHIPRVAATGEFPIVNACEYVHDKSITSVYVDNVTGAQQAVDYLVSLGHEHIAFVTGPMDSPICVDRDRGYEESLRAAGFTRNPALTASGDFSAESGIRALDSLLEDGHRFTAVFCSNDEMAIGAMRAIRSKKLRVPEDISVIGFDDIRFARYMNPPLSTVAQPKDELGREAMQLLIEIMRGINVPIRKRVLATQLIVRGSTARPTARA